MEEELDFAGRPVIGAAAIMHKIYAAEKEQATWTIGLNAKSVEVSTVQKEGFYSGGMNQGKPEFGKILTGEQV